MPLEFVAVVGCTIAHSAGSGVSGGAFVITTPPSATTSAGAFVYSGPITFTFSGGNFAGCTPGTVAGGGSITPTAAFVSADALPVVREGDTGVMTGVGTNLAPPPATLPAVGPVEITLAGQVEVKAQ